MADTISDTGTDPPSVSDNSSVELLSGSEILRLARMSRPDSNPIDDSAIDPQLLTGGASDLLQDNAETSENRPTEEDESDNDFNPHESSTPFSGNQQRSFNEFKRKRLLQESNAAVGRFKLSAQFAQELRRFALCTDTEQRISIYGGLLSITESQQTVESAWSPGEIAMTNIAACAIRHLISPDAKSYKNYAEQEVEDMLIAIPQNGLPAGWKENPAQAGKVSSIILEKLTEARSAVKKVFQKSVKRENGGPWDIQKLANTLSKLPKQSLREDADTPHWGRYALMRTVGKDKMKDALFYDRIDEELASIRKDAVAMYGANKTSVETCIHRTITTILNVDMSLYGYPKNMTGPIALRALPTVMAAAPRPASLQGGVLPSRKRPRVDE